MIEAASTAGAFLSQLIAGFSGEAPADAAAGGAVAENFAQILAGEENLSEVLGRLRDLLPEAVYAQVEALLTAGKGLPQAADVAGQALSESTLTQDEMAELYTALGLVFPVAPLQPTGMTGRSLTAAAEPGTATRRAALPALSAARDGAPPTATPATGPAQLSMAPQGAAPLLDVPVAAAGEAAAVGYGAVLPQLMKSGSAGGEPMPSTVAQIGALAGAVVQPSGESVAQSRPALSLTAEMDIPLGDAKWDKSLGDRVLWMIGRAQQSASIKITPPDMGAIEIKVSVKNDQVNVGFTAQHAAVKEALEAAIPRLREMFGENNLQLVNVDVGQRGESGQRSLADGLAGQNGDGQQAAYTAAAEDGVELAEERGMQHYRSDGLLDDYA